MRRLLILSALACGVLAADPLVQPAEACPMCKYANEDGTADGGPVTEASLRPKAYMYSILFMISMPATLFAGFSFSFYRLSKQQQALRHVSLDGSAES